MGVEEIYAKLEEMQRLIISTTKEVLTLEEVALYTGMSKAHIYRLTSSRAIPHYKPSGGCLFFKKDEIVKWLLRGRRATDEEMEIEAQTYCVTKSNKKISKK